MSVPVLQALQRCTGSRYEISVLAKLLFFVYLYLPDRYPCRQAKLQLAQDIVSLWPKLKSSNEAEPHVSF